MTGARHMARYTELAGIDMVDSFESEGDLLSSKVSALREAEPLVPTSDPDPVGGTFGTLSGIVSVLDAITYGYPIVADPYPANQTLVGTRDDDEITGGYGNDVIYGLEGNDVLYG